MGTLGAKRARLTGGGVNLRVVATASGLDVRGLAPSAVGSKLKVSYASGADANTNITVSGITTSDILVSVLELQPPTASSGGAIKSDQTANTTIYSNNTIRISQSTAGNQVLVIWWDVS